MELTEFDKNLLNILQEHLPLSKHPFQEIGKTLGVTEEFVLNRLKILKDEGFIRRIGAFFDSNRLGYTGTLVALKVDEYKIEEVAKSINKETCVTHNYEREGKFNLWFTLLSPNKEYEENFLSVVRKLDGVKDMLNLKAKRKYKINVAFNLR